MAMNRFIHRTTCYGSGKKTITLKGEFPAHWRVFCQAFFNRVPNTLYACIEIVYCSYDNSLNPYDGWR